MHNQIVAARDAEIARLKAEVAEQTARADGAEGALDAVRRSLDAYRDALAVEQVTSRAAEVFAAESETEKWRIWATIIHRDLDLPPFDNNRLRDITRRVARPSMVADMQTREPSEFPYVYRDALDACEAERDAALAACAEMRAALECAIGEHEARVGECCCAICDTAKAALSRPDLGAGMVVVTGPLDAFVDNLMRVVCDCHDGSDLWAHTRRDPEAFRRAVRDALLKKGGG